MMSIPGVKFEEAWKNRESVRLGDVEVPFISRPDLILAKRASGRLQDKIDIGKLKEAERFDSLDKFDDETEAASFSLISEERGRRLRRQGDYRMAGRRSFQLR